MCIRDRYQRRVRESKKPNMSAGTGQRNESAGEIELVGPRQGDEPASEIELDQSGQPDEVPVSEVDAEEVRQPEERTNDTEIEQSEQHDDEIDLEECGQRDEPASEVAPRNSLMCTLFRAAALCALVFACVLISCLASNWRHDVTHMVTLPISWSNARYCLEQRHYDYTFNPFGCYPFPGSRGGCVSCSFKCSASPSSSKLACALGNSGGRSLHLNNMGDADRHAAAAVFGLVVTTSVLTLISGALAAAAGWSSDRPAWKGVAAGAGLVLAAVAAILLAAACIHYAVKRPWGPNRRVTHSEGGYTAAYVCTVVVCVLQLPTLVLWLMLVKEAGFDWSSIPIGCQGLCRWGKRKCAALVGREIEQQGHRELEAQDLENMSLLDDDSITELWKACCPRLQLDRFKEVLFREGYLSADDLRAIKEEEEFDHLFLVKLGLKRPELRRLKSLLD
eukprot:TRINITY_DN2544_c0_g1_i4.p1 TRINITY_DN2544_c0_g1~~TRINITY_DN2544_c0_g1_i4.p1  ORF type:complete len:449 (-),score=111.60 TRINITY_DN2544_c0_g1_i4:104-1450(-)